MTPSGPPVIFFFSFKQADDIPKRRVVMRLRIIDKGIRGGTEISCREIRLLFFESGMVHQSHAPSPRFGSFDTLNSCNSPCNEPRGALFSRNNTGILCTKSPRARVDLLAGGTANSLAERCHASGQ